jgi:hypothetical protein
VKFAAQDVPLDPQWLGIWLGDGSSSACKITTADKEILEYITTIALTVCKQSNKLPHRLRHHKWKCRGGCPAIPFEDIQNAMALMDTDENFHGELYQKSVVYTYVDEVPKSTSREVWRNITNLVRNPIRL